MLFTMIIFLNPRINFYWCSVLVLSRDILDITYLDVYICVREKEYRERVKESDDSEGLFQMAIIRPMLAQYSHLYKSSVLTEKEHFKQRLAAPIFPEGKLFIFTHFFPSLCFAIK